jgi:hypothetical protein
MAITTAICNSFKLEVLEGVHQPGDDYRMALYAVAATLNKGTTVYSATNEVSGPGYTAGGKSLTSRSASLDTDTAIIDFADPAWPNATITARGALIYNASRGNKAVSVHDFGADITSTNGSFTATLPAAAAATAIVRIG